LRGAPGSPALPPLLGRVLAGDAGDLPAGLGLAVLLGLLFVAVATGAFPVVRRLTRRLEALQQGVEAFGAGALDCRVNEAGHDEVAAVAASFNRAAGRIQTLIQANQNLLANASHELRSPLARLKMAVTMLEELPPAATAAAEAARSALKREIHANIGELDALVEEVLLSSRLESGAPVALHDRVDMLGLLAEECARVQATLEPCDVAHTATATGSDRLLRRAVRNLLENARRYGGGEVAVSLRAQENGGALEIEVADRGPGVPEAERERIFEPFYRLEGHAEREGGVGLGLALVRQIVRRHGGSVRCLAREGGGSRFVISLPAEVPSAILASSATGQSSGLLGPASA
jgi:signal transduction histidine kinase